MESEPKYTAKTLRAMRTGGSVLSHNKAEVVITAQHTELGEIRGTMTGIASHGVAVAHRADDPLDVAFVALESVTHAEVNW